MAHVSLRRFAALMTILAVLTALVVSFWPESSDLVVDTKPGKPVAVDFVRDRLLQDQAAVEEIWQRLDSRHPVLTEGDLKHLENAARFAVSIDSGKGKNSWSGRITGRARLLLGSVSFTFSEYSKALEYFRQSGEAFSRSYSAFPDPVSLYFLAKSKNLEACLLAEIGRYDQAAAALDESIARFRSLDESDVPEQPIPLYVAGALRSRAIIEALRGRSGREFAAASARILDAFSSGLSDPRHRLQMRLPDLQIDSRILMTQLAVVDGRNSDAKQALAATRQQVAASYAELNAAYHGIRYTLPSGRYRPLLRTLQKLQEAFSEVDSSVTKDSQTGSVPSLSDVFCLPVSHRTGWALHPELLFRGYMPAEFTKQYGVVLIWNDLDWSVEHLVRAVTSLSQRLDVHLLISEPIQQAECLHRIRIAGAEMNRLHIHEIETDSVWIRDFGPIQVSTDGESTAFLDAVYGINQENPRPLDERIPFRLGEKLNYHVVRTPLLMQGGELLVNGSDLCVVSSAMMKRNLERGLEDPFIRSELRRLLGIREVVVVDPLTDEPTQHIDWFLTFPSASTVIVGEYADASDPNSALLDRAAETLANINCSAGPLKVVRIPMPERQTNWFGGTYTNVVYANGLLLMPEWEYASSTTHKRAVAVFREQLPDWEIVSIPSDEFGRQEGSFRCLTLNLPLRPSAEMQRRMTLRPSHSSERIRQ